MKVLLEPQKKEVLQKVKQKKDLLVEETKVEQSEQKVTYQETNIVQKKPNKKQ